MQYIGIHIRARRTKTGGCPFTMLSKIVGARFAGPQAFAVPEFSILSVDPGFDFQPWDFGDGPAFQNFSGNSTPRFVCFARI